MNKFKEWFQMKRILTFVLAVAMVVTMLPTTALAAEMPEMNLEQNEEVAVEEVSEATEDAMLETTDQPCDASAGCGPVWSGMWSYRCR